MIRRAACMQIAVWVIIFLSLASATVSHAPSALSEWCFYIISWSAFAGVFTWIGAPALRSLQDPSKHPVVKRLAAEGNIASISEDVDRERRCFSSLRDGWGRTITDRYLVLSIGLKFDVYRLSDVLWAYARVLRTTQCGIPMGTDFYTIVKFADGEVTLRGTESEVLKYLQWIEALVPWAVFGYSSKLDALYRNHRTEFESVVQDRRRQIGEGLLCSS